MDAHKKHTSECEAPAVCKACEARNGGICGTLSASQLAELNKHSTRRKVEAGNEVIGQGESVGSYSNILNGVVKLSKMMADGRQQIVGLQFAPDFLGRPFLTESSVTAEAATETEICCFPRPIIDRMVGEAPDLERKLHSQSLKELDEARDWMLTLGRKT
ncbi:MAG: Crp/Fnr family transcriptional regulator, partial [Rhizobium sp.]|nr:Crp/Fnr family transcriptional regulator [Rhizobium sp.]